MWIMSHCGDTVAATKLYSLLLMKGMIPNTTQATQHDPTAVLIDTRLKRLLWTEGRYNRTIWSTETIVRKRREALLVTALVNPTTCKNIITVWIQDNRPSLRLLKTHEHQFLIDDKSPFLDLDYSHYCEKSSRIRHMLPYLTFYNLHSKWRKEASSQIRMNFRWALLFKNPPKSAIRGSTIDNYREDTT